MTDRDEFRPADDGDRAWLTALVKKADAGDQASLQELRGFLDANPQLWRRLGDMAGHVEMALVGLIAGGDSLVSESVRFEAERLRQDLLGDDPGAVERLLADQVVVTHLRLRYLEVRAAEAGSEGGGRAAGLARQVEGARRGHLSALRTLAVVRKLGAGGQPGARLRVVAPAKVG